MTSDTASTSSRLTVPISPFSSGHPSAPVSEATSDEQPDLGAFTTVLRAWNHLQPHPRIPTHFHSSTSTSSGTYQPPSSISSFTHPGLSVASGTESPLPQEETVWEQPRILSYLNLHSDTPSSERPRGEDDYDINSDSRGQYGFDDSPPLFSPATERTVEIDSDIESASADPLNDSSVSTEMPVPVTVFNFSPGQASSAVLHGSDEGDTSSLTSREIPVQIQTGLSIESPIQHTNYPLQPTIPSAQRGQNSNPSSSYQSQLTPRRLDFPIHESATSVASQSTIRTQVPVQSNLWSSQYVQPPASRSHGSQSRGSNSGGYRDYESAAGDAFTYGRHYAYSPAGDSEEAVRSLLNEAARARSLVNDTSSIAPSSTSNKSGSRPVSASEYDTRHDQSLRPTPESTTHSLASQSHSSDSQSLSLITQPQPISPSPHLIGTSPPLRDHRSSPPVFLPQIEPPSPLPTPEASETFPLSPRQHAYGVDEEIDIGDSHTPTRRPLVGGSGSGSIPISEKQAEAYLARGVSHPYPHSLAGAHGLPSNISVHSEGYHNESERSFARNAWEEEDSALRLDGGSGSVLEDLEDGDHPTLGLLDEALSFIAAERARFEAARESGAQPADINDWRHIVEPKRKRRRKKPAVAGKSESESAVAASSPSSTRPLLLAPIGNHEGDHDENDEEGPPSALGPTSSITPKAKGIALALDTRLSKATTSGAGKNAKQITILTRPKPKPSAEAEAVNSPDNARGANEVGDTIREDSFSLVGKKGKRVGRREREREKAKRDAERAAAEMEHAHVNRAEDVDGGNDEDDNDGWEQDVDEMDDPDHARSDGPISSPSATRDGSSKKDKDKHDDRDKARNKDGSDKEEGVGGATSSGRTKKTRPKRVKTLVHAKSFPNLRFDTDSLDDSTSSTNIISKLAPYRDNYNGDLAELVIDQSKRNRLMMLGYKLMTVFPEQKKDLKKVIHRLEWGDRKDAILVGVVDGKATSRTNTNTNLGKKRRGHVRGGSAGGGTGSSSSLANLSQAAEGFGDEEEQDPVEFEVQGPAPVKRGALIHIFIDHSNILIGLLNYLKRSPPPQSAIDAYLSSRARVALTSRSTPALALAGQDDEDHKDTSIAGRTQKSQAIPIIESPTTSTINGDNTYPIPLPSFARRHAMRAQAQMQTKSSPLSKSLPEESVLEARMGKRARKGDEGVVFSDGLGVTSDGALGSASDGFGVSDGFEDDDADKGDRDVVIRRKEKERKFPKHLWHAALAFILERGRAVSRRVVVTSSPLYQPMEKIQNLGYEVRVYIRVPDLGDGMDRERYKDKDGKHGSGKSKGAQTSPVKSNPGSSSYNVNSSVTTGAKKTHVRHVSGNTSAESGSAGSPGPPFGSSASPGVAGSSAHASQGTAAKIKYREQGVDELLQLKLHQAIADADEVPKGSTIVLATGDGNVSQFSEDGFLGPVRTALKRGWKVELYAWQDGLSRSWRREFGENSEWGQKGLFRIIPLEQFATSLVEAAGW